MNDDARPVRPQCPRCFRPASHCWCRELVPVATRTRLVILQHPRERTMKMGTARLAHLGLASSELHVGVRFDDHPRLRALAAGGSGRVALLYPDPAAAAAPPPPIDTLVVVDGTWFTARKMVARSPLLRSLPRLSLVPVAPSAYRIRREPAAHCLSTVEAIVQALALLEGEGDRFGSLLATFRRLIDGQIEHAARTRAPYRHERKWRRQRRPSPVATLLAARWPSIVVAQAEGNPHDGGGPHELIQLVAARPATGERFAALLRPRRSLGTRTAARLGLDTAALMEAEPVVDRARGAWAAFLRRDDVVVGWGRFTQLVLGMEGFETPAWLDLKAEAGRRLGRTGGVEGAAEVFGPPAAPWAPGRGGVRVRALESLVTALRAADGSNPCEDAPPHSRSWENL